MRFSIIFLIIPFIFCELILQYSPETISDSQSNLQNLQNRAKTNACMRSALHILQINCKNMTDDDQSRLAIMLSNCHFQKSGKPLFPCSEEKTILECTKNMTGDSWNTYTEFYTHSSIFYIFTIFYRKYMLLYGF